MRQKYRSFESLRSELYGISNFAINSKLPFQEILSQQKLRVFDTPSYKRLTIREKEYLRGMTDAQLQVMYHFLQWAFIYDGQYCEQLPYGDNFRQELVNDSFHHYKGFPNKRF